MYSVLVDIEVRIIVNLIQYTLNRYNCIRRTVRLVGYIQSIYPWMNIETFIIYFSSFINFDCLNSKYKQNNTYKSLFSLSLSLSPSLSLSLSLSPSLSLSFSPSLSLPPSLSLSPLSSPVVHINSRGAGECVTIDNFRTMISLEIYCSRKQTSPRL